MTPSPLHMASNAPSCHSKNVAAPVFTPRKVGAVSTTPSMFFPQTSPVPIMNQWGPGPIPPFPMEGPFVDYTCQSPQTFSPQPAQTKRTPRSSKPKAKGKGGRNSRSRSRSRAKPVMRDADTNTEMKYTGLAAMGEEHAIIDAPSDDFLYSLDCSLSSPRSDEEYGSILELDKCREKLQDLQAGNEELRREKKQLWEAWNNCQTQIKELQDCLKRAQQRNINPSSHIVTTNNNFSNVHETETETETEVTKTSNDVDNDNKSKCSNSTPRRSAFNIVSSPRSNREENAPPASPAPAPAPSTVSQGSSPIPAPSHSPRKRRSCHTPENNCAEQEERARKRMTPLHETDLTIEKNGNAPDQRSVSVTSGLLNMHLSEPPTGRSRSEGESGPTTSIPNTPFIDLSNKHFATTEVKCRVCHKNTHANTANLYASTRVTGFQYIENTNTQKGAYKEVQNLVKVQIRKSPLHEKNWQNDWVSEPSWEEDCFHVWCSTHCMKRDPTLKHTGVQCSHCTSIHPFLDESRANHILDDIYCPACDQKLLKKPFFRKLRKSSIKDNRRRQFSRFSKGLIHTMPQPLLHQSVKLEAPHKDSVPVPPSVLPSHTRPSHTISEQV